MIFFKKVCKVWKGQFYGVFNGSKFHIELWKNQIYYSEQFPCLKLANNKRELWLRKLSEILEILMNMAEQSYLPTLQVIVCRLF